MSVIGNAILLGGNGFSPKIPSTYQRVEYVDLGTSTQVRYNLGVIPSNHYVYAEIVPTYTANNNVIFGTGAGSLYFHMTFYADCFYWGRNGNEANSASNVKAAIGARYEIQYNYGNDYSVIINGISCGSGTQITVGGNNLVIGWRTDSYRGRSIRFYVFQVTDKSTGQMVRNLIPCYRKSDNEIGFYDTINGVFYANQGTGTPIAGSDV